MVLTFRYTPLIVPIVALLWNKMNNLWINAGMLVLPSLLLVLFNSKMQLVDKKTGNGRHNIRIGYFAVSSILCLLSSLLYLVCQSN